MIAALTRLVAAVRRALAREVEAELAHQRSIGDDHQA